MNRRLSETVTCACFWVYLLVAVTASAQPRPSSDLLLPHFQVSFEDAGVTTLFAVVNSAAEPVPVRITVSSNWAIGLLEVGITLEAGESRTVNLRDWIVRGILPEEAWERRLAVDGHRTSVGPELAQEEVFHLQDALSGRPSLLDGLFYSAASAPGGAQGSVTLEVQGSPRSQVLFGDYFLVAPGQDLAHGDTLVDLVPDPEWGRSPGLCRRHGVRFLSSAGFGGGTEIVIWSARAGEPSPLPDFTADPVGATVQAFSEAGEPLGAWQLELHPVAVISLHQLGLDDAFGWLDVATEVESSVGVRYSAEGRYSVSLPGSCLANQTPRPALRLEKLTNGEDADTVPGPGLELGTTVQWHYIATNTGDVTLWDIRIRDQDATLRIDCPADATSLAPGEALACHATGNARLVSRSCGYRSVGAVSARSPDGAPVSATDASHYHIAEDAGLDLEMATNGHRVEGGSGPRIWVGDPVVWTYTVTNTGGVALEDVLVRDDVGGRIACPAVELGPGQSMTCRAEGLAQPGPHRSTGRVTARTPLCGSTLLDRDTSRYFGERRPESPGLDLETRTNGEDGDEPPGAILVVDDPVVWTFVVTNTGDVPLHDVAVTDDPLGAIACPRSALGVGQSMTCRAFGVARFGQHRNVARARATSPAGVVVEDRDPSHYRGVLDDAFAAIHVEVSTNGHDADTPPGATIPPSPPVTWTYVVINLGDFRLDDVAVHDDQLGAIPCPRSTLDLGQRMTCSATGVAQPGPYRNQATATGTSPAGVVVEDHDLSHYLGQSDDP